MLVGIGFRPFAIAPGTRYGGPSTAAEKHESKSAARKTIVVMPLFWCILRLAKGCRALSMGALCVVGTMMVKEY